MIDAGTVAATAGVTAVINFLVWLGLKRSVEATDRELAVTRRDLKDLTDRRLQGLEQHVQRTVTEEQCTKEHQRIASEISAATQRLLDVTVKVERVSAETGRALEWVNDTAVQLSAVKEDLYRLLGASGTGRP